MEDSLSYMELVPPSTHIEKPGFMEQIRQNLKLGFKACGFLIPLFIWLTYVQTFAMFPGVTLKKIFNEKFFNPGEGWGVLLLLTSYNLGDIVGKHLGGMKIFIKTTVGVVILLTRFIFFFFYLFIATNR